MWFVVILWLALGYELSWDKGHQGLGVDLNGARVEHWRSHTGRDGVLVTLAEEKMRRLGTEITQLRAKVRIAKGELRSFAGFSGLESQYLPPDKRSGNDLGGVGVKDLRGVRARQQVDVPLRWLEAFVGSTRRCCSGTAVLRLPSP